SLLVERGALTEAQLTEALREQQTSDRRLGEILVVRGYVTTLDLVAAVIDQHGLERSTEAGDFASASLSSRVREVYEVEGEDEPGRASVLYRTGGGRSSTARTAGFTSRTWRRWARTRPASSRPGASSSPGTRRAGGAFAGSASRSGPNGARPSSPSASGTSRCSTSPSRAARPG